MQNLILEHYPPVIKQMKEIQQIAKAENMEFTQLNTSIDAVICNMFVFSADETGVRRFEKLLGITPKETQGLDARKIYVASMMNRRKMSLSELAAMLSNYSEGVKLINDMEKLEMLIETGQNTVNIDVIDRILDEILPLNVYYQFLTQIKEASAKNKIRSIARNGIWLKVKPYLPKSIKAMGQNDIRAATFIGGKLKVKPQLNKTAKGQAQNAVIVQLQAVNALKVKHI